MNQDKTILNTILLTAWIMTTALLGFQTWKLSRTATTLRGELRQQTCSNYQIYSARYDFETATGEEVYLCTKTIDDLSRVDLMVAPSNR